MAKSELEGTSLLQVARDHLPTGRGRPRPALLRRVISTAYYAGFHALANEVTTHVGNEEAQLAARRLIAHTNIRGVCRSLLQSCTIPWMTG